MKRRDFCAAGVAALAAATVPYRRAAAITSGADIPAVGLDGRQLTLKSADIEDLRAGLRGELITGDEPGYDVARRLWNPAFDRKPALIVRCVGAADVRRAVSFTAAHGLLTAVRGGGHSVSGQSGCDGGLVIDVSPMRAVEVDPLARVARVEAGALLGQIDRETLAFGLVTPVGTVADTGVAGLTLGGGVGRIGRRFGLTCDNLTAAELVTADGKWLRVSAAEHPDLLWALRGGGGNFGVVTSFTFRLHEVAPIMYGGLLTFPLTDARQLLHSFADLIAAAPDELYVDAAMGTAPQGVRWLGLSVCYCGPQADAERVVGPLRKLGKPACIDDFYFRVAKPQRALRFKLLQHLIDRLPRQREHHGARQEREVVGETMRGARLPQTRGPHPDDAGAFHRQPRLGCGRRRACRRTPQVRAAATDNGHLIAHRGPVLRQGRDEGTRRGDIGRIEEVDEGNAHRTSWFDQTCAAKEAVPAALARVPTVIRPTDACDRAR